MRDSPAFTQVLVTRFSVRLDGQSVIRGHSTDWLFSEKRLQRRLTLFSNLTFPSIAKSTEKPEHHIIVVDSELPEFARLELESLVAPFPWAQLHVWLPGAEWYELGWVMELVEIHTAHVLVSIIDDDDALELGANQRIRKAAHSILLKNRSALWIWLGSNNAWEWDLDVTQSDLGFLKPYSGGTTYWQGVGTSVIVPRDGLSPTPYVWPHSVLQLVFNPFWKWKRIRFKRVLRMRLGLLKRLIVQGHIKRIPSLLIRGWLYDVGVEYRAEVDMLISNSGTNLQNKRIALGQDARWTEGMLKELGRFGVTEKSAKAIAEVFHTRQSE